MAEYQAALESSARASKQRQQATLKLATLWMHQGIRVVFAGAPLPASGGPAQWSEAIRAHRDATDKLRVLDKIDLDLLPDEERKGVELLAQWATETRQRCDQAEAALREALRTRYKTLAIDDEGHLVEASRGGRREHVRRIVIRQAADLVRWKHQLHGNTKEVRDLVQSFLAMPTLKGEAGLETIRQALIDRSARKSAAKRRKPRK